MLLISEHSLALRLCWGSRGDCSHAVGEESWCQAEEYSWPVSPWPGYRLHAEWRGVCHAQTQKVRTCKTSLIWVWSERVGYIVLQYYIVGVVWSWNIFPTYSLVIISNVSQDTLKLVVLYIGFTPSNMYLYKCRNLMIFLSPRALHIDW